MGILAHEALIQRRSYNCGNAAKAASTRPYCGRWASGFTLIPLLVLALLSYKYSTRAEAEYTEGDSLGLEFYFD